MRSQRGKYTIAQNDRPELGSARIELDILHAAVFGQTWDARPVGRGSQGKQVRASSIDAAHRADIKSPAGAINGYTGDRGV